MNFSHAKALLDQGKMARRAGWHFKDTFVFKQVPSQISIEIVPKMTSLPQAVKDEFIRRSKDESMQVKDLYYNNQYAIVGPSNLIEGYSPSVADIQAEDWEEYSPQA